MAAQEIRVPDIGDFTDVPIIEIHVAPGDTVAVEDPLLTLECDKATLDVPSPVAGTVTALAVAVGDTVSEGTVIGTVEVAGEAAGRGAEGAADQPSPRPPRAAARRRRPTGRPGGADRAGGLRVVGRAAHAPQQRRSARGGRSRPVHRPEGRRARRGAGARRRARRLHRRVPGGRPGQQGRDGRLPRPARRGLPQRGLHPVQGAAARGEGDRRDQGDGAHGLSFAAPTIDLDALRTWKDGVVTRLTGGLAGLAKQRKVTTVVGTGTFISPNMLRVTAPGRHDHHGVASTRRSSPPGSEPVRLPFVPHDDPRVIDSTGALDLDDIPERLLVLGGGIIGLEMATVYSELGTKITVVELMDQLIPGADKDLVTPLTKRITKPYDPVWLGTKVTASRRAGRAHRPFDASPARTRPRRPRPRCSTRSSSRSEDDPTAS